MIENGICFAFSSSFSHVARFFLLSTLLFHLLFLFLQYHTFDHMLSIGEHIVKCWLNEYTWVLRTAILHRSYIYFRYSWVETENNAKHESILTEIHTIRLFESFKSIQLNIVERKCLGSYAETNEANKLWPYLIKNRLFQSPNIVTFYFMY